MRVLACRPRLFSAVSLEGQVTTQEQGGRNTETPRLNFYMYPPAMHRYMIYSASSNNLSLYFCQCTVLLKPVYIQPHDDAWLLTLIFFRCRPQDFIVGDNESEVAVVDNDQRLDDNDNDVI